MAPFSRTVNSESTGSGLMLFCSCRLSSAIGRPVEVRIGVTLETMPTSAPPMLTSSPWPSSLASAACTCSL